MVIRVCFKSVFWCGAGKGSRNSAKLVLMAQKGGFSPELQRAVQQEQAKAQLQRTVSELTSTCWEKCIGTPGRSLSSREEACLSDCARRFIDTTNFIVQRAQSQQGGGGGGF
ncbi:hypothetical protein ABBQ38_011600 [Trebouxia sp. C0009 RCD-2024]